MAVVSCGILLLLQQNHRGPEREAIGSSWGLVGSGAVATDVRHKQQRFGLRVRGAHTGRVLVETMGK